MDFNKLYLEHQAAAMRADRALDGDARAGHRLIADGLASQIQEAQRQLGAAAACGWTALRAAMASNP